MTDRQQIPKMMTFRLYHGSEDVVFIQCPIDDNFIDAMKKYLDTLKISLEGRDKEAGLRALFGEG